VNVKWEESNTFFTNAQSFLEIVLIQIYSVHSKNVGMVWMISWNLLV